MRDATSTRDGQGSLATLPKAELHVHLAGTIDRQLASVLGRRNGVTAPTALDYEAAAASSETFFATYGLVERLLQHPVDYIEATAAYAGRAAADGVRWIEIAVGFPSAASRTSMGDIISAVHAGLGEHGVRGGVIATLERGTSPAEATEHVLSLADGPLPLAVGIAGPEVCALDEYTEAFDAARSLGLRTVAHVGPLTDIAAALTVLRVDRLDHGFRIGADSDLVRAARERSVPLALCPATNVLIGPVETLDAHPLPALVQDGLHVSLSSDDPALLGVDLLGTYEQVRDAFALTDEAVAALAVASFTSSFADAEIRQAGADAVDAWRKGLA